MKILVAVVIVQVANLLVFALFNRVALVRILALRHHADYRIMPTGFFLPPYLSTSGVRSGCLNSA